MKCSESQNHMMKFFDKEINDIEEAQFRQHLKTCTKCSEEFFSMRDIFADLEQETAIEPPEDFELQVMNRIEKEVVLYKKPGDDSKFAYNILLVAMSLVFVSLFGGILWEALKNPLILIQNIQMVSDLAKEFFSSAVTMLKGMSIAVVAVTASVYKTYYYAYILLGILLLVIQRAFFKMIKDGNGGYNE